MVTLREPPGQRSSADQPGAIDSLNSTEVGPDFGDKARWASSSPTQVGSMGDAGAADPAEGSKSQANWLVRKASSPADFDTSECEIRFMPDHNTRPRPTDQRATTTRPPTLTSGSAPCRTLPALLAPQPPPW